MISKKEPRADIEKQRTLYGLIGISVALVAIIFVMQWRTETIAVVEKPFTVVANLDNDVIPIIIPEPLEVPKKQKVTSAIKTPIPIDISIVPIDDEPKVEDTTMSSIPKLADIGDEPIDETKDVEPVPIMLIQKIAMPLSCEKFNDRDEQLACFNSWISNFIVENVQLPKEVLQFNLKGKVYIQFVVDENGKLASVKTVKGAHDVLNKEAERVLSLMPDFKPAEQHGKKVKMSMTIPVNFK